MRSKLAEELIAERRASELALSAEARVELMFALGQRERERLVTALGVSDEEARRMIRRARALGRKPSVANEP